MEKTFRQSIDAAPYAGVIDEKNRLLALVRQDEAARQKLHVRSLALFLYDREDRVLLRLDDERLTLPLFRILDGREDPFDIVCERVRDMFTDEPRILTQARIEKRPLSGPFMLAPSWTSHLTILRMRIAFRSPNPASRDVLWLDEDEYNALLTQEFCTRDPFLASLEKRLFRARKNKNRGRESLKHTGAADPAGPKS